MCLRPKEQWEFYADIYCKPIIANVIELRASIRVITIKIGLQQEIKRFTTPLAGLYEQDMMQKVQFLQQTFTALQHGNVLLCTFLRSNKKR